MNEVPTNEVAMNKTARGARHRLALIGFALTAGLTLSACGGDGNGNGDAGPDSGDAEPTELRVASLPIADLGAYFYAIDNGIFTDHGITVENVSSTGGAAAISAMLSGDVDIAYSGNDSVLKSYAQGLPVVIVAAANNNQPDGEQDSAGLVVPAGTTAQDLAGATLATNALDNINQVYTQQWLEENGVDPAEVSFVEVPFPEQVAALQSGDISGSLMPQPFMAQALEGGAEVLAWPYRSGPAGVTPIASFVSQGPTVEEKRDAVDAFVVAMEEANTEANDEANRDALITSILSNTQLTEDAAADISFVQYTTEVSVDQLDQLAELLVRFEIFDEAPDLSGILMDS